mgnify:CR=1 FL=1
MKKDILRNCLLTILFIFMLAPPYSAQQGNSVLIDTTYTISPEKQHEGAYYGWITINDNNGNKAFECSIRISWSGWYHSNAPYDFSKLVLNTDWQDWRPENKGKNNERRNELTLSLPSPEDVNYSYNNNTNKFHDVFNNDLVNNEADQKDSEDIDLLADDIVSESYQESLHESQQTPSLSDVENTENADEKSVQNSNLVGDKDNFPRTDNDLELTQNIDLEVESDDFDIDLTESDFENVSNSIDAIDPTAGLPPTLEMADFVVNADLDNFSLNVTEDDDLFQQDNSDNSSFSSDLDSDLGKASR